MNHESPPSTEETGAKAVDESEVARVFDAYLADLEAGRAVDPARLLADHPTIADQLRDCLAVMDVAGQMAVGSGVATNGSAPGPARPISLLTTLDLGPGEPPQVFLRDLPDEPEPLTRPRSTEMPRDGASPGRYQLQGEIARGGMGAILKGRDIDLGRDLAIKVLLEAHQGNPQIARRFVEEAQIGGQLQHPGIVPVYDLGTFADRRPFFAMKLVKGRTLASLLAERSQSSASNKPEAPAKASVEEPSLALQACERTAADLPRFLSIFEAVCQTMAYAHARGVIHRDLKPSNVMVGSFGEVQVMDWGLAKVLPHGGIADEFPTPSEDETVITTVRSGSDADASCAGSVLGTPSYMAPEQARGELDRVDERADVFGLGAILCEILTGKPPFLGRDRHEIRERVARGDLTEVLRRLEACGAEPELVSLCRDCLAAEPVGRPRDASEVARRMSSHLAGVQERLRIAELARAEAQARAAEERKRRSLTMALAAAVLLVAGLAGGGWTYLVRQRQERAVRFNRALGETEGAYADAKRVGDDQARWLAARDAAHALEGLLADAPDASTRIRVTTLVRDVTEATTAAEIDQELLAKLVDIRSARADDLDGSATDEAYAGAFREAGIDVDTLPPAEVGERIKVRPPAIAAALAAALDDWAAVCRELRGDQISAARLAEAARLADPDPWRNRLRAALDHPDKLGRLASLRALTKSASVETLGPISLDLLGNALIVSDPALAESVLRAAARRYAGDVWLNFDLARVLEVRFHLDEAIRYFMAARALRPGTAHSLAHALEQKGETEEAIEVFRELDRLRFEDGGHLVCLGSALQARGRAHEAATVLVRAADALRAAIRLKPELAHVHGTLGLALQAQGRLEEAVVEYRAAIRLKPGLAIVHLNLGGALLIQGKPEEADAACREAVRLNPYLATAHCNLGSALQDQGRLEEAVAEYRIAIQLEPDLAKAHNNLGIALKKQGKLSDGIAKFLDAIRLKPDYAEAHSNLGRSLVDQQKFSDAVAQFREATRLKPDFADAHNNLGYLLVRQGKLDEAIAEFRETIRLKPDYAEAHFSLGSAVEDQGKTDEALAEYRTAIRLKPGYVEAHTNLGNALANQGKVDEAITECREAIRLKPDHAIAHHNLGYALQLQGRLDEAVVQYREAIRLEPGLADAHSNLGSALKNLGKPDEAVEACRAAIRLDPNNGESHCNLGLALCQQGRYSESLAELRRGHELGSRGPNWRYSSAQWVREVERMVEIEKKLPEVLEGKVKPADAAESLTLAQMAYDKKLHGASARIWAEAFGAQPMLAEDMQAHHHYNAACAAALAGCGQGKDEPPLDEAARIRWRKQAIDWLRADLAYWSRQVSTGPPPAWEVVARTLQHWKTDTDLAGIREDAALAKLPEDERKACRTLWSEVDGVLKQTQSR